MKKEEEFHHLSHLKVLVLRQNRDGFKFLLVKNRRGFTILEITQEAILNFLIFIKNWKYEKKDDNPYVSENVDDVYINARNKIKSWKEKTDWITKQDRWERKQYNKVKRRQWIKEKRRVHLIINDCGFSVNEINMIISLMEDIVKFLHSSWFITKSSFECENCDLTLDNFINSCSSDLL